MFQISLLCRYIPVSDRVKPSAPVIVKDVAEYEVEALTAYREWRG